MSLQIGQRIEVYEVINDKDTATLKVGNVRPADRIIGDIAVTLHSFDWIKTNYCRVSGANRLGCDTEVKKVGTLVITKLK